MTTNVRHLGRVLQRQVTPEPLNIEQALERSIAIEKAKKADRARWIVDVVKNVRTERAKVEVARKALIEADKGDFKNVSALFIQRAAMADLIEALDRLNLALTEHYTLTTGARK